MRLRGRAGFFRDLETAQKCFKIDAIKFLAPISNNGMGQQTKRRTMIRKTIMIEAQLGGSKVKWSANTLRVKAHIAMVSQGRPRNSFPNTPT